jgi:hypothetical protein
VGVGQNRDWRVGIWDDEVPAARRAGLPFH